MELFKLFGRIAINGTDEARQDINDTTETVKNSESRMIDAFKKIGSAVATYFAVDKIIEFGKSVVDASATVSAEASAFEQIMGSYSDNAQAKLNEVADATGIMDTRLTPYMTSMTAKFKGLGYDIDDATSLASEGLTLAADAAAFWDKSLEDSMSGLNSFINGSYEGGEAIGLFANDTQLALYAVKTGVVSETKEWANLDEARKQATRLKYAQDMYAMSGATGQAAKEADQYANVQANLTEKWRQFKAQIGEPLLQNVVLPAIEKLSGLIDVLSKGYSDLTKWISENKDTLSIAIGVFASAAAGIVAYKTVMMGLAIINTVKTWLNGMTLAQKALNLAMSLNPIGIVIGLITALVAAFIYFWNTSEGFRNFWIGLWETIKSIFSSAVSWVSQKLSELATWFSQIWEGIKNTVSIVMEAIRSVIETVWNVIQSIIVFVITAIAVTIGTYINIWRTVIETVMNAIKFVIDTIWNAIGGTVTSVMNAIASFISTVWNSINSVISTVLNAILSVITTIWNSVYSSVSNVVSKIYSWISDKFNAIKNTISNILNAVKSTVSSIWNSISSTISSVVNAISSTVSSVFNSVRSTVSSVFNSIKSTASSVWNGIKTAIETPINAAKNTVKSVIDSIKGFFNFKFSWPKLPLPHFSIKPKGWAIGDLLKGSIPSLGIDWYAKGAIFDEPTIFPTAQGFKGVGEAGSEAVTPIDVLLDYVRTAVKEENESVTYYIQKMIDMMDDYMRQLIAKIDRPIVLDDGTLVAKTAKKMDDQLGLINRGRRRGQ